MTTSAPGAAGPWSGDAWAAETVDDYELLAQDSPAQAWPIDDDEAPDDWGPVDDSWPARSSPHVERVDESTAEGLTGRALVLATAIAAGGCAILDLGLTGGRMTFFFDLCFVVICLVGTMAVRRDDLFTAGVLPPLLFAAVIAVVAVVAPQAFESAPGVNKVFLSGLASHAGGLVGGYGVALMAVAARMAGSETRAR